MRGFGVLLYTAVVVDTQHGMIGSIRTAGRMATEENSRRGTRSTETIYLSRGGAWTTHERGNGDGVAGVGCSVKRRQVVVKRIRQVTEARPKAPIIHEREDAGASNKQKGAAD